MKLGTETGSLVNHIYGNCPNKPVVGKGATKLSWTDREAYEVLYVNGDQTGCTVQMYQPKLISGSVHDGSAEYEYKELLPYQYQLTNIKGTWYHVTKSIEFRPSYMKKYDAALDAATTREEVEVLNATMLTPYFAVDTEPGRWSELRLVKGVTYWKTHKHKWNIAFGILDKFYDPEF